MCTILQKDGSKSKTFQRKVDRIAIQIVQRSANSLPDFTLKSLMIAMDHLLERAEGRIFKA